MKKIILSFALATSIFSVGLSAQEFEIAPVHTDVGFVAKHLGISKVSGRFDSYTANIDFDTKTHTFKMLDATINAASVSTNNAGRDEELKGESFFKTQQYPKITFKMTKYEKISNTNGKAYGKLTIAGITKNVILNTEVNGIAKNGQGKQVIGFSLTGKINRKDFKVGQSVMANAAISNDIKLSIDVEAVAK